MIDLRLAQLPRTWFLYSLVLVGVILACTRFLMNEQRFTDLSIKSTEGLAIRVLAPVTLKEVKASPTNEFDDVRMIVSAPKVVQIGTPASIEIRIENRSRNEIWIRNHRELCSLDINLSAGGIECTRTKQGTKLLRPNGPRRGSGLKEIVQPSETVTWSFDLNHLYVLGRGVYQVAVRTEVEFVEQDKVRGAIIAGDPVVFNVE